LLKGIEGPRSEKTLSLGCLVTTREKYVLKAHKGWAAIPSGKKTSRPRNSIGKALKGHFDLAGVVVIGEISP